MKISDNLLCLFSVTVEEQSDAYTIEIPKQEVTRGDLQPGAVYRTAILATGEVDTNEYTSPSDRATAEPDDGRKRETSQPSVKEGDIREVDIEDIGKQGDGITRVDRGFVVIVPETEQGERVTIEITDVQPNVAFGEVKERQTHFP